MGDIPFTVASRQRVVPDLHAAKTQGIVLLKRAEITRFPALLVALRRLLRSLNRNVLVESSMETARPESAIPSRAQALFPEAEFKLRHPLFQAMPYPLGADPRLLELGFLPLENVRVLQRSWCRGGALVVQVGDAVFGLRPEEAEQIPVQPAV